MLQLSRGVSHNLQLQRNGNIETLTPSAHAFERAARRNLPYIYGLISFTLLSHHFRQSQQIFHTSHRPALGQFDERILAGRIGPGRRHIAQLRFRGEVIHAPLPPTRPQIDQFKASAAPRMKRVGDGKKPFWFVRMGCSPHTRPKAKSDVCPRPFRNRSTAGWRRTISERRLPVGIGHPGNQHVRYESNHGTT